MNRQLPILLGLSAISLATYLIVRKYIKAKDKPPKNWKKVGTLTDLMLFPIKSCGVIKAKEMECTKLGLQIGSLMDRFFMVVNSKNEGLTGRIHPRLVLIQPKLENNTLVLEAPEMEALKINLDILKDENVLESKLWGDPIPSVDCGDSVATWFSQYLLSQPSGLRLVYFPKSRENAERIKEDGIATNIDTGTFTDLSSYNLMNASSVDELNTRLEKPVTSLQFRPNFVVEGPNAFEEDNWHWVKIGDVVFKVIKDCTRCMMTTVDPDVGVKSAKVEPLTTLKKYRIIKDSKQSIRPNKVHGVLGVHLTLQKDGIVKIGDSVMVG